MAKYTPEELNSFSKEELISLLCTMQDQLEQGNQNLEHLIEQIRLVDRQRFGRKTEKLGEIAGQMSLFNEAETLADLSVPEPDESDVVIKVVKKKKAKGQREEDCKDLPREEYHHALTDGQLDDFYGKGNWRRMKPDSYLRVRCQPATFTAEYHVVDVVVGTDGDHQDEFLRGDRPKDLIRNSVATPSLVAAVANAKYLNAMPLARIERQFEMNGVRISRQTMANWMITVSQKYLGFLWTCLHMELINNEAGVLQADETTCQVINDNDPNDPNDTKGRAGHKNYMWVYRTGEFETKNRSCSTNTSGPDTMNTHRNSLKISMVSSKQTVFSSITCWKS